MTLVKFGIFVFGDNHPELGRSNQKYFEEVLTIADWAEELGFDSFWLGEHHLYWYGTCVSPPMMIAAISQRTKKIRLGPAIAVPSFHNPLVLAEEYALADNLSNGRLEFALGSGFSPVEFKTFGMTMEEAKERFWEGTDVILKAWREEKFTHHGKYYHYDDATLYVKPVQQPMPPIWLAASSDDTLVKAGQLGWPMMGIPFARSNHLADVKVKNDLYLDSYRKNGHVAAPSIMVAMHVCLHQNDGAAAQLSRPYFERVTSFTKTHRRPGAKIPDFDEVKREKLGVFATPEEAVEIFRAYEKIGVTHVIAMVNFGGLPMADARRTLELMAREVFPKVK
ncbi:MAG: LLM class flavin-dependent oxidoreductase [Deltaproteobacteria bacterium]|nr:LLM class flavin-dependent oxidoreductase [Deltaproteobacteria bacterium]